MRIELTKLKLRAKIGIIHGRKEASKYIALGDVARDSKDWLEAANQYKAALELSPNSDDIWVQLGNCLKEGGNRKGALDAYNRAVNLDSTKSDTFLQLGHVQKLLGSVEAATHAYEKALDLDPLNDNARIELFHLCPGRLNTKEFGEGPEAAELAEFRSLLDSLKNFGSSDYWIFHESPFETSKKR